LNEGAYAECRPSPSNKVLVLFGPTASGKTAVLERLFAKNSKNSAYPAEIISADSMQVYRGMDIGTAKPSLEERSRLPHHLIDIREPNEQFNVGEFVRLAREAILATQSRRALPVVSGGTGFYLKNLILGLPASPPSDSSIRAALKTELAQKGAAALMEELAAGDPTSAQRIHINDQYRLLRALEVLRLSGRPLSSYAQTGGISGPLANSSQKLQFDAPPPPVFDFLILGLNRSRDELYRRINERCSAMFRQGLPDELRRLYEAGFTQADPGLKAIGYKEFFVEADDGKAGISGDLAGVEALIASNCRHYAKRQMTYFASIPGVIWIDASNEEKAAAEIREKIKNFTGV
jgi:tRNA dimethylallyltransferase